MKRSSAPESKDIGLALFTPKQYARLLSNGKRSAGRLTAGQQKIDYHPVVKLIDPVTNAVWLVTEIDPTNPTIATGLIDLGDRNPSVGEIDLRSLVRSGRVRDLGVRADNTFRSAGRLSSYVQTAKAIGRVIA
ncbi:MAG: DUF2958 domain-containing protein [Pseudomonadota bacterium]